MSKMFYQFISYYPLKQGLKHDLGCEMDTEASAIYILLSIKTRIETVVPVGAISRSHDLYPTIH